MPRRTRSGLGSAIAQIDALRTALRAATALADEVAGDSLQRRLIEAFRAMPAGDRPTILGVVEREVRARLVSRATESVTGQSARANPNARLYVRTHGPATRWRRHDADDMMLAMLRMIRVASGLALPATRTAWRTAMREAIGHAERAERDVLRSLVRDVEVLLDEAERAVPRRDHAASS